MSIKSLYPDTRPSLNLDFANTKVLDPRITFARASTATYVDNKGILQTVSNNVPRFDHNISTGESLGLLIEEARTNFVFGSGGSALYAGYNFSAESIWTITAASTDVRAPDGSSTTTKAVAGASGNTYFWRFSNTFSHASNTTYTQSVWIRVASGTGSIGITAFPFGQTYYTNSITTQWQRISVTYTTDSGPSAVPYMGVVSPSANTTFYLWGWQIEQGAFPTSYIPTTTSQVTRSADSASMTGTNFTSWYNNTQGALYIESQNDYHSSTLFPNGHAGVGVEIHSNAFQSNMFAFNSKRDGQYYPSPLLHIFTPGGAADIRGNGVIGGGSNRISGSAFYKSSFSWNFGGTFATSADGTATTSASLGLTSPPAVTTLGFAANNYAYNGFNGRIKKLIYYPRSLTNTQLQALTQP